MLASAIVGGAASVLGGGKFANGAITAAFAYAATATYTDDEVDAHEVGGARYASSQFVKSWFVIGSQNDAAESAYEAASEQPLFQSREYGGELLPIFIDALPVGYIVTMYQGGIGGVSFPIDPGASAWWHTHPWDSVNAANNENLSNRYGAGCGNVTVCDVQTVQEVMNSYHYAFGSYLLTPSSILKYYPNAAANPNDFTTLPYTGPRIH